MTMNKFNVYSVLDRPDEVYHVTVMPCYDKKLEAARDDFVFEVQSQGETHANAGLKITEVDSVLTSGEVLDLLKVILSLSDFDDVININCIRQNDIMINLFNCLLQSQSVDFEALEESPLDKL